MRHGVHRGEEECFVPNLRFENLRASVSSVVGLCVGMMIGEC